MTFLRKLDATQVQKFNTWLFDCDGVLWNGTKLIPGAKELISGLKKQKKNVYFVTNNSLKSRKEYCKKFKDLGFSVNEDEIACTAYIAAQYLKNSNFKGKVYLMGSSGMAEELDNFGIPYTGFGPDHVVNDEIDFKSTTLDPEVKCVVVGFDRYTSYLKVLKAASYINYQNCPFIATNEDHVLPMPDLGLTIPGTGSIVKSVEIASDTKPTYLGKPHAPMFETLRQAHNIDLASTVIVGDRLNTDIALGRRCGFSSLLVLTGVSSSSDAEELSESEQPHFIMPSVKEISDLLP